MASKLPSSSNYRRQSPRLSANLQIPPSDMKNGRRPPVRRGQIPNFGYRNLNPPKERNMELDESYNSFTQLQDDDIEAIEENCVGAIGGTHIRVKVSNSDAPRYRGRKSFPTQNILVASNFDLMFTYVLPGWEGSASDSIILNDSLTREIDRLIVPEGKYYLADGGFQFKVGFLTPFRSTRYHLNEYSVHGPQDFQELFNLRHAKLINVVERSFRDLKKRFAIWRSGTEPHFYAEALGDIVLAGCIIHNYLMGVDPDQKLIAEVDRELAAKAPETYPKLVDDCREGEILRESIALDMWKNYNIRRRS